MNLTKIPRERLLVHKERIESEIAWKHRGDVDHTWDSVMLDFVNKEIARRDGTPYESPF